MKALKVAGIVVGVVALAATGVGLALGGAAAAGSFLGVSAATWMTVGAVAGIAGGVIGLGTALFAPKPGFSSQGNPLSFQTNPQSGLPYPVGRTRMSGLRIHGETYDGLEFRSEGKDDVLSFAVMLGAGGPMQEIESFRADKEALTFDPSTGACVTKPGWTAMKWSLGLAGASALALSFGGGAFPGWTADHKLSGIAHALWDLRGDPKGEHWGAGVPEPEWVGKWTRAYDPRKDSTYPGGSGPHRALNESTYEYTNNGALIALTWCLGRWQNGKRTLGIGAPVSNIRVADFVEAANVADANGWHCGGVEWSTDPKWTVLKRMLQSAGAEPTMTGAMIGCRVNMPRVSIATVPADKLLDGLSIATTRSRRDRFNTVIPRYRSEDHDWEVISGSPVTVPLYVSQDKGQRTKEIDFPLVQHERDTDGNVQAGQLAAYEIVNSREAGPIRFTVGPEYIGIKTGDVVTLDVPEEGLAAQPVLIRSRSIDPASFKITFEAETETTAKHDFALGRTTVPPPTYEPTPPDLTPPVPDTDLWSLTADYTDIVPSLTVSGVCEFPGADAVIIEYRPVEVPEAPWLSVGKAEASAPVEMVISPVEGDTAYEARVAYQSGDRLGDWLVLAPVGTPDSFLVDFNQQNNRNADPIATPTIATDGTAVDHVINADGSADVSFEWGWSGTNADIDGFQIMLVGRTSNAPYVPGTTPAIEDVWTVPADKRAVFAQGLNPTAWYTWAVRAYRRVDKDISSTGLLVTDWAKPTASGENPYRPSGQAQFLGDITGTLNNTTSTAAVIVGVDRATGAINSDYTIQGGKVVTASVAVDAINNAAYGKVYGTWALPASTDFHEYLFGSSFVVQGTLEVEGIVPIEIEVVNPVINTTYSFEIWLIVRDTVTGNTLIGEKVRLLETWRTPSATGTFSLARRYVSLMWKFDDIWPSTWEVGFVGQAPATNNAYLPSFRFLKAEDKRAIK